MDAQKYLKLLVYSPSGHGKTTLLATAKGDDRLLPGLIIDFEGGAADSIGSSIIPIKIKDIKSLKPEASWYCVRVHQWDDFQELYDILPEHLFKTIAIDSLSEINNLNLTVVVSRGGLPSRPVFKDLKMPQIQDYGNSAYQMNVLIRAFRDLDVHFICTAGVAKDKSAITGDEKIYPALVGSLKERAPHLFNVVGYLGIHPGSKSENIPAQSRVLIAHSSEDYEAKFRNESRSVPPQIINPTLPIILDYFERA